MKRPRTHLRHGRIDFGIGMAEGSAYIARNPSMRGLRGPSYPEGDWVYMSQYPYKVWAVIHWCSVRRLYNDMRRLYWDMRRLYWYDAGFGVFLVHPPMASVLLSASVERCFVSRMRDFSHHFEFSLLCTPQWCKSDFSSKLQLPKMLGQL